MFEKFYITCNEENHWTLTDAARADDKILYLHDEYEKFWQKILRGENFALQNIKGGVKNLLPLFGKKIPLFFCTRNYASSVQNLFRLRAEDCYVLDDENNQVNVTRLFEQFRPGAIHIFFADVYEQLRPLLEQRALREGVDFTDGRGVLIATTN